jgi:hypothetical protein
VPETVSPVPSPTLSGPPIGAPPEDKKSDEAKLTIAGYLEAYYQAHFQDPSNRITNLRGYDNRSRGFTLSNVAIDLKGEKGPVTTRIILQVGHTPSTYYLAEPASAGTGAVNASSSELWKYLQTATVTVKGPSDTTFEAGLFPSPVGIEVLPIKDNWNWSRSNLFFGLPGYHTGARISHPLGGGWTGTFHLYNGWNSVVDNNDTPSLAASAGYASASTTAQLLYFGGVERASRAPEGKPWRHLFDALVQYAVTSAVTVAAQADAGFEPNDIGTSSWGAAALCGKLALSDKLYAAVRGDYFYEKVAEANGMTASAIFWPRSGLRKQPRRSRTSRPTACRSASRSATTRPSPTRSSAARSPATVWPLRTCSTAGRRTPPCSASPRGSEASMTDLLFLLVTVAFFAISIVYTRGLDRI